MSPFVEVDAVGTDFSRLTDLVEAGGEVIIARSGKPIARLVKYELQAQRRVLGFNKEIPLPDDPEEWLKLDLAVGEMFSQASANI